MSPAADPQADADQRRRVAGPGRIRIRYFDLGLLVVFFLLVPLLGSWLGEDSRNRIETDECQHRQSRSN